MAGSDLFNIGVSGLVAYQRTLNTISHNISNVNTEGYNRQSVHLSSNPPQAAGSGFIGTGVGIETISRSYDAYLESNLRTSTTSQSEYAAFYKLASQLDQLVADADVGMSNSIQNFFDAIQDVADSPSDPTARTVMLNESEQLSRQFNQLHGLVDGMRQHVNTELRIGSADINRLSSSIATLNERIVLETGRSGGQPPNDLLDQRDAAILELSEYVSVTTLRQDDGAVNVMIGKGQPLVVSNNSFQLSAIAATGDPDRLDIALDIGGGSSTVITAQLTGGSFGGVINFQQQITRIICISQCLISF